MPTRWGAGTWTDQGTYAEVTLGVSAQQDHWHKPYTALAGETIVVQMDVMLPTTGAVSNIILWWYVNTTTVAECGRSVRPRGYQRNVPTECRYSGR